MTLSTEVMDSIKELKDRAEAITSNPTKGGEEIRHFLKDIVATIEHIGHDLEPGHATDKPDSDTSDTTE